MSGSAGIDGELLPTRRCEEAMQWLVQRVGYTVLRIQNTAHRTRSSGRSLSNNETEQIALCAVGFVFSLVVAKASQALGKVQIQGQAQELTRPGENRNRRNHMKQEEPKYI